MSARFPKIFTLFLFTGICCISYSQNRSSDSLKLLLKKDKEDTISCIFIPQVDSALQSHYNDISNKKKPYYVQGMCAHYMNISRDSVESTTFRCKKLVCPIAHRLIGLWTLNCNDPPTASIWTVGLNAVLNRATNHSINHKKLYSPKLSPDIKGN